MISPETRVQIRRYFYAEHWKIGTIATALDVHPDTVRRAIEVERFQHAEPLGPSIVDPYLPFVQATKVGAGKDQGIGICQFLGRRQMRKQPWNGAPQLFGMEKGCGDTLPPAPG